VRSSTDPCDPASAERWWRTLLAAVCGVAATFVLLSSIAWLQSEGHHASRQSARAIVVSEADRPTDLYLRLSQDYWRGQRISIAFISPVGRIQPALPPGMTALPPPGSSVVSPALDALARDHPDLASLYPKRTVLADAGVAGTTELVAYLRPAVGRSLGGEAHALHAVRGALVGDRATVRVASFGGAHALPSFADESTVRTRTRATVLAVVPALMLLVLGARRVTGIGASRVRVLGAAVAAGAAVWATLASRADHIPLLGVPFVPGERDVLSITLVGCLGAVSVGLLATAVGPRIETGSPRGSATGDARWQKYSMVPLALSGLVFVASRFATEGPRDFLSVVASAVALLGVCTALPTLLAARGRQIGTSDRYGTHLAGEVLADAPDSARAYYPVAVVAFAALALMPLSGSSTGGSGPSTPDGMSAVAVTWRNVEIGDLSRFQAALAIGQAIGFDEATRSVASKPEWQEPELAVPPVTLGVSCDHLRALNVTDCGALGRGRLSAADGRRLARVVGAGLGEEVEDIRLSEPAEVSTSGKIIVLARADLDDLDAAVRFAARGTLPAALIESGVFARHPDRSEQQALATQSRLLAVALCAAALVVALSDVLSGILRPVTVPERASRSKGSGRAASMVTFASSWLAAGGLGAVVGYAVRVQTTGVDHRIELWELGSGVGIVGLAATCAGVVVIAAAGRRVSRVP